jgi:hypothetical protein
VPGGAGMDRGLTAAEACGAASPSLATGSIRSEVAPERRDHCRATR